YTAEQIIIPPSLPGILKDFTKAAIRTQPEDPLLWSAAYFDALSRGVAPPVKARYEGIGVANNGGVSKGKLATLHSQMEGETVNVSKLRELWTNIGCKETTLSEILSMGDMNEKEQVIWRYVLALACTTMEKSISCALKTVCEIMSTDSDGGDARISFELFSDLYSFLAKVDGDISEAQIQRSLDWLKVESERFDGNIGPREFKHPSCPKLSTKM
ncbi:PREDICTED: ropporin-1-like protein, partial [Amphimedon queenslandica]